MSDARERSSGKVRKRRSRLWLILSNVVLIASAVVFIIAYSTYVRKEQRNTRTDAFISAVESMKQISTNSGAVKPHIQSYLAKCAKALAAGEISSAGEAAEQFVQDCSTVSRED